MHIKPVQVVLYGALDYRRVLPHIYHLSPVHARRELGLQLEIRRCGRIIVDPMKRPAPLCQLLGGSRGRQLLRNELLGLRKDFYRLSVARVGGYSAELRWAR